MMTCLFLFDGLLDAKQWKLYISVYLFSCHGYYCQLPWPFIYLKMLLQLPEMYFLLAKTCLVSIMVWYWLIQLCFSSQNKM